MQAEPTSEALFESLCQNSGQKFISALGKIKGACDAIVMANGSITYSQVGKVAEELYGGPKTQSILNNVKHKSYIDARKRELFPIYRRLSQSDQDNKSNQHTYPVEGLDYKTRRYIDDLRQRCSLLEATMRELKHQVLLATERTPIDLSSMLGSSADQDVFIPIKSEANVLSEDAMEAIRVILDELPRLVPDVDVYQGKALRLRTGEWLLSPAQFAALKALGRS